ncbi:MAG: hypothetical protein WBP23_04340 [Candidatus Saccharimonadales bacterium]
MKVLWVVNSRHPFLAEVMQVFCEYPATIQLSGMPFADTPDILTMVGIAIVSFTVVMTFVLIAKQW